MAQSSPADRLRGTLEKLLAIPSAELESALDHACTAIGEGLAADKVDAFLYEDSRDSLVALGSSATELSGLQKRLGLDVLPISNGGRVVHVFQTGQTFVHGRLQDDAEELRGVRIGLEIQSEIGVPLDIGGRRRGMLMVASQRPDFFGSEDVRFAESVARWVAIVAHRAELVEEITRNAVEQGRRKVAEELVTVLAHDLRNYLNPISARLQLVRSRAEKAGQEEHLRDASLAMTAVERLGRLISDLLDVARLDQGIFALDLQPVDLAHVAREASRVLAVPDHQIVFDKLEQSIVAADSMRLRQAVDNLVCNAIQHSSRGAAVTLQVWNESHDGQLWGCLEVRNDGPGIPVELMPRLFERFASGPGSKGLGLGLYLAQRILVAHGGQLTATSPPDRGACFQLRLPCYSR